MNSQDYIKEWNAKYRKADFQFLLKDICDIYPKNIIFSTSFNIEDQIITHFIAKNNFDVEVFTLDTGRLFQQTYSTWQETINKYKINIKVYYPNEQDIQTLIATQGPNGFYNSIENRIQCCNVRKVKSLEKALKNKKIWITGVRAEHSEFRQNMNLFEWDERFQIIKFNPLLYWSKEDIVECIKKNQIPYNPLFDKGFLSIGCEPCTRAIKSGEQYRDGRWWWENNQGKKECGLHTKND